MAKAVLQTGLLTFDGTTYGVTEMRTGKTVDEVDVTDTASPAGEKEFISTGRVTREVSVTLFKNINAANLVIGEGKTSQLDFEGFLYDGTIIWTSFEDVAPIDNAFVQTYSGRFSGTVTETVAS